MILTTLAAAGALNAAVVAQSGENYCHLTWDKQCCPVPGCDVGIAPGILTICNEKPDPAEFVWELIDSSGMGLQFMPQNGVAAPGNSPTGLVETCIDVPFTVICPPNFPLGGVADYQAIVTKVSTGEQFTCFGNVRNVSDWKVDPVGDPVIDVPVPVDVAQAPTPVRANLVVSNLGSSGKDGVRIHASSMGNFDVMPSSISIPPIPPGTSFAVDSFFDICYGQNRMGMPGQGMMGDILFKIDTTGDGQGDTVIGSLTVRGVPQAAPCPTDINGDGVTDTADLGLLIGSFGTFCP